MNCKTCGTKNKKGSTYCEKCGHRLSKINKNTLIIGFVSLIVIIGIIILGVLLQNPVKQIEDKLGIYYKNYNSSNKELGSIGRILKANKDNSKVLNSIKNTTNKITDGWVRNFNRNYKNKEELTKNYEKVTGAIKDIYNYYNGLEYMIDRELYNKYLEELNELRTSKEYYLRGLDYTHDDNKSYNTYYNYQKVIEADSYYKEASKFIKEFVSGEIENLKNEANKIIDIKDDSSNEELYNCYVKQLKYLNDHELNNNIDLSRTEEYQEILKNTYNKILEYTKKIVSDFDKDIKHKEAIEFIDKTKELINDEGILKELDNLKKEYEDKMPDKLIDKYCVSYNGAKSSSLRKIINNEEYENNISFSFTGKTQDITYRLNNEYKRLKMKIVKGSDWDKSFSGYFVITGDDKELYKSLEITKTNEINDLIDIDISDVDDLKIEFVTENKPEGWDNFYIYLVEPYLYK